MGHIQCSPEDKLVTVHNLAVARSQ